MTLNILDTQKMCTCGAFVNWERSGQRHCSPHVTIRDQNHFLVLCVLWAPLAGSVGCSPSCSDPGSWLILLSHPSSGLGRAACRLRILSLGVSVPRLCAPWGVLQGGRWSGSSGLLCHWLFPPLVSSFRLLAPWGVTHCHNALATVSPFPGSCPSFGAVTSSVPASSLGNPCRSSGVELVDSSPWLLGVSLPSSVYCVAYLCVCACSVVSNSL